MLRVKSQPITKVHPCDSCRDLEASILLAIKRYRLFHLDRTKSHSLVRIDGPSKPHPNFQIILLSWTASLLDWVLHSEKFP